MEQKRNKPVEKADCDFSESRLSFKQMEGTIYTEAVQDRYKSRFYFIRKQAGLWPKASQHSYKL
jgi:hypothetical protein